MAGSGGTTFQKRQKEMARKERQQEKFAKRLERKKAGNENVTSDQRPEGEDSAENSSQLPDDLSARGIVGV